MPATPFPRHALRWAIATLIALLLTGMLAAIRAGETASGLIYLVMVVWVAAQAGRWLSLYVAALAAACFDYYFLRPVHSFWIAGLGEWLAMISFLVSCLLVGRVAERARRQTRQAEQRREDVERLYELSQRMMLHEDAAGLIREVPRMVERVFGLDGVVVYVRDEDQSYATIPGPSPSLKLALKAMTGTQTAGQDWLVDLPEDFKAMALMLGLRSVGALAWKPDTLSREVAAAVSAQVAIALTRALAMEASTRMEAAREGDRLRTALIDSFTHELRTPLTAIRAAATTLQDWAALDDIGRQDLISLMDEESKRLDDLIGEAVEMAEIDAQAVRVHLLPQHMRALLDQAVEGCRGALAAHPVILSVEGADKPVWCDPHLIGRVLRHLLENAARYTPPGTRIVLRGRRMADRIEFQVEDSGPGIDSLDLPMIFEKFYRGKAGLGGPKGSGMGLAIARAILKAHGGSIEVDSRPGQGTSFRFWVPLVEKASAG